MAEGFITRRGGVSSEQALAPTITFVSKTDSQIVFTIKNNDDATAVILWELDDATPDANSLELAADTTSSNITVTGLDDDTEFIVYATANVTGKVKSNVSQLSITTDETITFISATGGTTLEYNESGKRYKSHTFTSSGTFTVNSLGNQNNELDYLIVAGGAGGGGGFTGGGGGAGGYRTTLGASGANSTAENKVFATAQSYTITVGGGGNSGGTTNKGSNGANSSALGITSTGGGGGGVGSDNSLQAGLNGGSGGGGGSPDSTGNGAGGNGTSLQGRNGGNGGHTVGSSIGGGGGGGAFTAGSDRSGDNGGAGGNGLSNTIRNGSAETRAGGGSGGSRTTTIRTGGSGGGGNGGNQNTSATSGTANTGGGGGGIGRNDFSGATSGAGGSGIVIIRYEIAPSA